MGDDWLRFREGKGERRKVARACCSVVALVARSREWFYAELMSVIFLFAIEQRMHLLSMGL